MKHEGKYYYDYEHLQGWNKLARSICDDYKKEYDDHPEGLRMAITELIHRLHRDEPKTCGECVGWMNIEFHYVHPKTGERKSKSLSMDEIQDYLETFDLLELECDCESVGESTTMQSCEGQCSEYYDEFERSHISTHGNCLDCGNKIQREGEA